ncbi:MAG: pyridoxamine 5'-phosphate oxidase [Halofilum sp. (in: g-proteobacteria)]
MAETESRYREAIARFQSVLDEARAVSNGFMGNDPAMTLATTDAQGRPSLRTVLLKGVDERGFVFYTNLNSRKGRALAARPHAALLFFWPELKRQVNVEGGTEAVSDEESNAYWSSRPRESQLGAWASDQSAPLANREEYEQRLAAVRQRYRDCAVPRPPYWAGFRVVPDRIEFWHEREFRQHERECFWREGEDWRWTLLNP